MKNASEGGDGRLSSNVLDKQMYRAVHRQYREF